ncbi:glutathione S-transferase [Ferrovibrio sp.]|uniref:glutathione S-transferase n=1 Tax=Ferrovibrio sp. TaxID=1917215 RepID=UPI0035AE355F
MTNMKLYYAPASPFVRKINVVAIELGIDNQIERLDCAPGPIKRDRDIIEHNPLGQIPTFLTEDGDWLYDSRVICEYLDHRFGKNKMFPAAGPARWRVLRDQSIGDGILDAAILVRYETWLRPEEFRWADWESGQIDKIFTSLAAIEADIAALQGRVDMGTLTIACSLSYLDFRFDRLQWRAKHPKTAAWYAAFAERPSMRETQPYSNV